MEEDDEGSMQGSIETVKVCNQRHLTTSRRAARGYLHSTDASCPHAHAPVRSCCTMLQSCSARIRTADTPASGHFVAV